MAYDMKKLTEVAETGSKRIKELEAELRESCLSELAALGQAEEAYEKQRELEALNKVLTDKVRDLTALLDALLGTPCEQIRHKQEVEAIEAEQGKLEGVIRAQNYDYSRAISERDAALDRIEELEAEQEEARKGEAESEGNLGHALHQLRQVKAENARLRDALSQFANETNWFDVRDGGADPYDGRIYPAWRGPADIPEDFARAALEESAND